MEIHSKPISLLIGNTIRVSQSHDLPQYGLAGDLWAIATIHGDDVYAGPVYVEGGSVSLGTKVELTTEEGYDLPVARVV